MKDLLAPFGLSAFARCAGKVLCVALSALLVFTTIPTAAFADETGSETVEEAVVEESAVDEEAVEETAVEEETVEETESDTASSAATTSGTVTASGTVSNSTNSYQWSISSSGVLTIKPLSGKSSGTITGFDSSDTAAPWYSSRSSIKSVVVSSGMKAGTSLKSLFYGLSNATSITFASNWDTSNCSNFGKLFYGCSSLTSLDLSGWDVSSGNSMANMFQDCSSLKSIDFTGWSAKPNSIAAMFSGCSSLTSLDLTMFNTSRVTSMTSVFAKCSSLTTIKINSKWNTSNVTTFAYMFNGCSSLTTVAVSGWDTSKATSMTYMFNGCSSLKTLSVSSWKTSKVTDMARMFNGAGTSSFKLDISSWNTSAVTTVEKMFYGFTAKSLDASGLNLSKCTDMTQWLYEANIGTADLSGINASKVTSMEKMFMYATFDSLDISGMTTSAVKNMASMFYDCDAGDSDIDMTKWTVSKVTDVSSMFCYFTAGSLDLSGLNFAKATDLTHMFYEVVIDEADLSDLTFSAATAANEMFMRSVFGSLDVSNWTISSLKDATSMFYECDAGDSALDLSGWEVSSITSSAKMFAYMTTGSLDATGWKLSKSTECTQMFYMVTMDELDLDNWTISVATSIDEMFMYSTVGIVNASGWKAPKLTSACRVFQNAGSSDSEFYVSNWTLASVTAVDYFFYGVTASILEATDWSLPVIDEVARVFATAEIEYVYASGWSIPNATTIQSLASNSIVTSFDATGWDTSSLTSMKQAFQGMTADELLLGGWDVSNLETMSLSFNGTNIPAIDYSGWDIPDGVAAAWTGNYVYGAAIGAFCAMKLDEGTDISSLGIDSVDDFIKSGTGYTGKWICYDDDGNVLYGPYSLDELDEMWDTDPMPGWWVLDYIYVDQPVVLDIVYTGSEQTGVTISQYSTVTSGTITATEAGTYTATVSLKEPDSRYWEGTDSNEDITVTWTISPYSISADDISFSQNAYTYDGTAHEPTVTVTGPDGTVLDSSMYTVEYSDNVETGKASVTVTITADGNYTGTATATFSIVPSFVELAGSNRYGTMLAIASAAYGDDTSKYAVLATGASFPDALAAASLAGVLDAPIVLVNSKNKQYAIDVLEALGVEKLYVVGGTGAVSKSLVSEIASETGVTYKRVYGSNRFETALAIASEVQSLAGDDMSTTCIVASGANYPDALSASPYSYWSGSPIYLVKSDGSITSDTLSAIESAGYTRIVVMGGTGVVSASTFSQLESISGVESVERVAGDNRYSTSAEMAEWSVAEGMTYDGAAIATGKDFPDALAGATICGRNGSVILLTASGKTTAIDLLESNYEGVHTIYFLGGTGVVSNDIRTYVQELFE